MTESLSLTGIIERVTFHNADNGFAVIKVNVRGEREPVTVVGNIATLHAGEYISCSGTWITDRDYGRQFRATFLRVTPPNTAEGMEKYLASGMIRDIGPVYAKRLVQAFGTEVFHMIEEDPNRLRQVEGIGEVRLSKITQGWQQQKNVREIMLFLHQHGVTTSRAVRIYKNYGEQAIAIIQENPYQLARDIRGIGFVSADRIALHIGIEPTSMKRLTAGIAYALMTAMDEGHCGLPASELIQKTAGLLEVIPEMIPAAIQQALMEEMVISDGEMLYLPHLYHHEQWIAQKLLHLLEGSLPWPRIDTAQALGWVQQQTGITLAPSQQQVLEQVLDSKVSIITGGPGVGKTTLMKCPLKILSHKVKDIILCAPTGRASKRLSESTGFEARTIHRLLEPNASLSGFKINDENPLSTHLLIIDECSMLDVPLMAALLKALPLHAGLIMIGDVDQLPSVGPGRVLADLIESEKLPTFRLTEIFRQAESSQIIKNAHAINNGHMPNLSNPEHSDFFFVACETPEEGVEKIQTIVKARLPKKYEFDPIKDIQVLCPMARGKIGARALNIALQAVLNPTPSASIELFGNRFGSGDKVMQTSNNYDKEVYNGDIGIITAIDSENQQLVISFEGRTVEYEYPDMDDVMLAYAITIHKSQGSEYAAVVIPFTMQSYIMLQRNLLYTAVTRGKQIVVLVGQKKAIMLAIKHRGQRHRYTKLKQWLNTR